MCSRKREPSVRLAGIGILKKEDFDISGLLFCFAAKATLTCFKRFRFDCVAIASDKVRSQGQPCEQYCGNQKSAHVPSLYLRLVFLNTEALGTPDGRRRGP